MTGYRNQSEAHKINVAKNAWQPPLNTETKGQKEQNDAALHVVFAGSSYTLLTVSILREGSWSFIATALVLTLGIT